MSALVKVNPRTFAEAMRVKISLALGDRPLRVRCDVCSTWLSVPVADLRRETCLALLRETDIEVGGKETGAALVELIREAMVDGKLTSGSSREQLRKAREVPKRCDEHHFCACGERLGVNTWRPSQVARRAERGDTNPLCNRCSLRRANAALTPEQRSERARKGNAALTPEQRSERSRKRNAALTPEQRSERARKGNAALTPEQRSEVACKRIAAKTPEQRSEAARKGSAAKTPEQRSEAARRANAALTPEQRSEAARKMNAAKTPEQRSEIARKRNAALTPEQRSERSRKGNAALTPEQRSERARRANAARAARRALGAR